MPDILKIKNVTNETAKKRETIYEVFLAGASGIISGDLNKLNNNDIALLFSLYDQEFFGNWFRDIFKGKIKFSISGRMTRSAGLTICPKNISKVRPEELAIEIRIGRDFFLQYGLYEGNKAVCGIKTDNSVEALQLVMEHEICHVIEFIHFKKSNCRGKRFMTIANNLFGHTERYHKLPTNKQIAKQKLGLNLGDTVSFTYKDKLLTGILYNINKRATVMVRNNKGPLVDNIGNRYSKYYVPLERLN